MLPPVPMARLLIVEDQPELAGLVAAAARARGHDPVQANLGQAALDALGNGRFDAAVVDLLLPDLHGHEVLRALFARAVPAFAVSGVYKGERCAREAVELHGARAFFEKPFDLAALLDAVERVTGAASAPPEVPEVLPFGERERVWRDPESPGPAAPGWAASGELGPGTLARLLNAYYQARHTGELRLRQGKVAKVVHFEEGRPVYAASNLAQERFARFCVRRKVLPESELAAVAALARESELRTGEAMVKLGLLSSAQRQTLLEEQIKEIIWSALGWTTGDFAFSPRRLSRPDLVKLSVFPGDLVMEGARREPLVALRRHLGTRRRFFPSADPPYALHELRLSGPEAHLLVWADGSKSVEDLVTLSDLPEREVLSALRGFELLGLVEERAEGGGARRRISFGL
jgi:CheY-like chemotaxis protein